MDAANRTIAFTGFGPFAEITTNPSWRVAEAAARASGGIAECFDVSFERAKDAALQPKADWVVHVGVAAARSWVALERTAINLRGPDVGDTPETYVRKALEDGGPATRRSSFDVERLCAEIARRWSGDVRVSDDAGAYVCNATLFHAIGKDPRRIFVHVPSFTDAEAEAFGRALGLAFVAVVSADEGP
jgi:pyroglutamyl-peptidase